MRNDKLSELSMDFSVDIIELVKELKIQRESVISNQIGRSGPLLVQTYAKLTMLMGKLILFQNFKLPSKKQTKQDIG